MNRSLPTLLLFFLLHGLVLHAQYGYFGSQVKLSIDNTATIYDMNSVSSAPELNGADLGIFTPNSGELTLTGANAATWKSDNTGNTCVPVFYYAIYETSSPPSPINYSTFDIPFANQERNPSDNGDNQYWDASITPVDLTSLAPGSYTLDVYIRHTGSQNASSGCGDELFDNNSGANYKATFTITSSPYPEISITPTPLVHDGNFTITFDATGTVLENSTKIYFHSGVSITEQSPRNFDRTTGNWGQDDGVGEMTSLGNNQWSISVANIRTYYNVDVTEDVFGLNFVFRNADGTTEVKDGSDDYHFFVDPGTYFTLESPNPNSAVEVGSDTLVSTIATDNATWTLYSIDANGNILSTITTGPSSNTFQYNITQQNVATDHYRIEADFGTQTKHKDFTIWGYSPVNEAPRPAGMRLGINYHPNDPTKATLILHAPIRTDYFKGTGFLGGTGMTEEKNVVHVIGDFNNWEVSEAYKLNRDRDGWDGTVDADNDTDYGDYWWITLENLTPGQPYVFQYLIDGEIRIGDPYTAQVSDFDDENIPASVYPNLPIYPDDKTFGRASVLQTEQDEYVWEVPNFTAAPKDQLHIYELHFRDFTEEGTYLKAIDHLDHIKEMGFNAIHVMPISEFEGNTSWGYNPNYYFAADKAYGTPNDLKKFIDECHKRDIAVFNDLVLNHAFGSNPHALMYWDADNNRPRSDNPWFNATHKMVRNQAGWWGNDWNHESEWVQEFVDSALIYWLDEFNFDGFRFDFTKGIGQTNPDDFPFGDDWASAYNQDRVDLLKRFVNNMWAFKPSSIAIFEHLANAAEDKELADHGILMWSGVPHHGQIKNFVLGYAPDNKTIYETGVHFAGGKNFAFPHWISYAESHDEERIAYELLQYGNGVSNLTGQAQIAEMIERAKMGVAFNLMIQGPRMMWEFQEYGYDYSINYNGRTGEKPVAWTLGYHQDPDRQELKLLVGQLLNARLNKNISWWDYGNIGDPDGLEVRYMKVGNNNGEEIILLANIDPVNSQTISPPYGFTGTYYQNNGEMVDQSFTVNATSDNYTLAPGRVMVLSNFQLGTPAFVDTDGDGIQDADDNCPNEAGLFALNGCPNTVTVSTSSQSLDESSTAAQLTLQLQAAQNDEVQVTLSLSGTASSSDYSLQTSVTIPAGATTLDIPITIIDDGTTESDETLTVTLSTATNAEISTSNNMYTLTILDNDATITCDDWYTLTGTTTNDSVYHAADSIISTQIVSSIHTIEYVAGQTIVLKPGFHATSGSSFHAHIDPNACTPATPQAAIAPEETPLVSAIEEVQEVENPVLEQQAFTQGERMPQSDEEQLIVYPNPVDFELTVGLTALGIGNLSIIDLNGRIVKSIPTSKSDAGIYTILTSDLPNGMYTIRYTGNSPNILIKKIVVMH